MIFFDRWAAEESAQISRIDFFRQSRRRQTIQRKRMFEKSWQIKTHGTLTRVRPSCLEAGMGKHSRRNMTESGLFKHPLKAARCARRQDAGFRFELKQSVLC